MGKKIIFLVVGLLVLLGTQAQTNSDAKAKQLEEMRKLKNQMMEEQKTMQQQQEWNSQSNQQEIKKLNQENQQKSIEIQVSKQEAQKARQDYDKAKQNLEAKQHELAMTESRIDSAKAQLASTQNLLAQSELSKKRIEEELVHKDDSVKILNQAEALQRLQLKNQQVELDSQKQRNRLYIIAAALSLLFLLVLGALLFTRQKALRELAEKNKIIQEEKRRSDELLLNILPEEVMLELKAHGKTQARNYSKATVLFADIRDFTTISEQLSPDDLIEGLDAYFERFDHVIEKYDIEKIKTIGDAYVCAGGVPTKSEGNPHLVVEAALQFMYEIEKLRRQRVAQGKIPFEFRIGIHTGQLVAGVIGIRKFAYDIWGDTVNMAARMQQAGEANKINISGTTYEMVKDKFACVYRGKIEAKNKGEIDMYFVEKVLS
ncbi:MAG: adenylate/guanylate cyclase [Bacteroidota bacterium]|nr:adenylate/guanylate cyclase [Bacteroidota bacterium]